MTCPLQRDPVFWSLRGALHVVQPEEPLVLEGDRLHPAELRYLLRLAESLKLAEGDGRPPA
jgi:hypothetical protein